MPKKIKTPTFNEHLKIVQAPNIQETPVKIPVVDPNANPDNNPFKFEFIEDKLNWNHKEFGWKKDCPCRDSFPKPLQSIIQQIEDKYKDLTFSQVMQRDRHSGWHKSSLRKTQKQVLRTVPRDRDYDGYENIFHVSLTSPGNKHRIYGYVYYSVFYPVLNDKLHKFIYLK
jgi:hypothetical protein